MSDPPAPTNDAGRSDLRDCSGSNRLAPSRQGLWHVVITFSASRLLIFAVMVWTPLVFNKGAFTGGTLLQILTHWDGAWYLSVAQEGYSFKTTEFSNVVFFPLYPLLIRALSGLGIQAPLAAVLLSNACLLGAGFLLYALARRDYSERVSRASVTLLMYNPVSFFYSSAYTESLFLLLSLLAFHAMRRRHWAAAAGAGMALALTRNVGACLAIPLALEILNDLRQRPRHYRSEWLRLGLVAVVPLGSAVWMAFCYFRFGDVLAFLHGQQAWSRSLVAPWTTLRTLAVTPPFYRILFAGTLAVSVSTLIGAAILRLRVSYLLYAAALVGVYVCSSSFESLPRYVSVVFPFYLVAAVISARYRWLELPLLTSSIAVLVVCTILTANGYWMT